MYNEIKEGGHNEDEKESVPGSNCVLAWELCIIRLCSQHAQASRCKSFLPSATGTGAGTTGAGARAGARTTAAARPAGAGVGGLGHGIGFIRDGVGEGGQIADHAG